MNMPLPITVPTTIAAALQSPRSRLSSIAGGTFISSSKPLAHGSLNNLFPQSGPSGPGPIYSQPPQGAVPAFFQRPPLRSNHDAKYPATKVVTLPINTHQVHAMGVKTRT